MARKLKKTLEVQKFGGTEELGSVKMAEPKVGMSDYNYDLSSIETESKTKLEHDEGYGDPAIIRCFEFGMNPEAFKQHQPTKQELFNHHQKGIETALWRDGMAVLSDIDPRIVVNERKGTYSIFVTAKAARGHLLNATPQTLSQIAHG